jgi:hypothetical protein
MGGREAGNRSELGYGESIIARPLPVARVGLRGVAL